MRISKKPWQRYSLTNLIVKPDSACPLWIEVLVQDELERNNAGRHAARSSSSSSGSCARGQAHPSLLHRCRFVLRHACKLRRTGGKYGGRVIRPTERTFKNELSGAIGVAGVAHGKSTRRHSKRIRLMKPAKEGTEWNDLCSKNLGHLGIYWDGKLGLPMEAIAYRRLPMICSSWWSLIIEVMSSDSYENVTTKEKVLSKCSGKSPFSKYLEFLSNALELSTCEMLGRTCGTIWWKKKRGSRSRISRKDLKRMGMPAAWREFSWFRITLPVRI